MYVLCAKSVPEANIFCILMFTVTIWHAMQFSIKWKSLESQSTSQSNILFIINYWSQLINLLKSQLQS